MLNCRIAVFSCSSQVGAAISLKKSLEIMIENKILKKENIDIYCTYYYKKLIPKPDTNIFEGVSNQITPIVLPERHLGFYSQKPNFRRYLKLQLKYFLGLFFYSFLQKKVLFRNYDLVLINQLPYWKLLSEAPEIPKIIFAREIFNEYTSKKNNKIANFISSQANKIIAIDEMTAAPFSKYSQEKVEIIINPFDMSLAAAIRNDHSSQETIKKSIGVPLDKKIVTLIGILSLEKGTDFFLSFAEKNHTRRDLFFLLCGDAKGKYSDEIKKRVERIPNLKHVCGNHDYTNKIYGISDLIVRCDSLLPLGRTLWEAVYSHVPVLIPCRSKDPVNTIQKYLNKQIFIYPARELKSFERAVDHILYLTEYTPINSTDNQKEHLSKLEIIFKETLK